MRAASWNRSVSSVISNELGFSLGQKITYTQILGEEKVPAASDKPEALIHLGLVASVPVSGITDTIICPHSGSQTQLQALLSATFLSDRGQGDCHPGPLGLHRHRQPHGASFNHQLDNGAHQKFQPLSLLE